MARRDVRRITFLSLAGASVLAGCAKTWGQWPEADWTRPAGACFLVLIQNMGGGNRMDGSGRGRCVLLDAETGELAAEFPYRPIDQAKVCYHRGSLAWASADGVHLLGERVVSHPGSGVEGALYGVFPAGNGFLAGINAGTADGDKYLTGLTLFDAEQAKSWVHDGWVPALGWASGQVVGYSYQGLEGRSAQLTILGPDHQSAVGEPLAPGVIIWSGALYARDEEVLAIISDEQLQPTVLRTDLTSGAVTRVAINGDTAIWNWHVVGDGPAGLYLDGDWLVWRNSHGIRATHVDTGVTEPRPTPQAENSRWWLQTNVSVEQRLDVPGYEFAAWAGTE